jgi:hypothetical protein
MSLYTIRLVLVVSLLDCSGSAPRANEPTTAREKQRRDAEAKGDLESGGGKWAGWRYTGDRTECFFIVGRRCFKTESAACTAARCGKHKCESSGGGPAAVSCATK